MNLIIGGTHGLGGEIAKQLQDHGEETFVTGRSYDEAEHGPGMQVDLANESDIERLTSYVNELGDTVLKGFFWVAGKGYTGNFADQPNPREMILVNLANVVPVAQTAWRKMLTSESESNFVVVSSTTGVRLRSDETVYATTKAGQVSFARNLGKENERLGSSARVSLIMPGGMQTEFWDADRPAIYDQFLDPSKVAAKIIEFTFAQEKPYDELTIERGSL